jgi:hypothetical protein
MGQDAGVDLVGLGLRLGVRSMALPHSTSGAELLAVADAVRRDRNGRLDATSVQVGAIASVAATSTPAGDPA